MMKVWGGCFDGRNRLIVAAKTKKAALEAINKAKNMNVSRYAFDMYASDTGNEKELEIALSEPGAVFIASIRRGYNEDYTRLESKETDQ